MFYNLNTPYVLRERFDDEDILVNLDTGLYYLLDNVGAGLIELLESGASPDQVKQIYCEFFSGSPDEISNGVDRAIDEFVENQLIKPTEDAPAGEINSLAPAALDSLAQGMPFTSPVLARFDDMQEALLLDPVHEVDEAGWPHPFDRPHSE